MSENMHFTQGSWESLEALFRETAGTPDYPHNTSFFRIPKSCHYARTTWASGTNAVFVIIHAALCLSQRATDKGTVPARETGTGSRGACGPVFGRSSEPMRLNAPPSRDTLRAEKWATV